MRVRNIGKLPILPILDVLERRRLGPWSVEQRKLMSASLQTHSQIFRCFTTLNQNNVIIVKVAMCKDI